MRGFAIAALAESGEALTGIALVASENLSRSVAAGLRRIIEAAVLAPSADNHHRFRLRVRQDRIEMEAGDGHSDAPFHRRILNLISFGAAVENMTLRAASLGIVASVKWAPDPARPALIAELSLTPGDRSESPLEGAIGGRHTNRTVRFHGPPLDAATVDALTMLAEGVGGVRLVWAAEPGKRATLLQLIRLAEAERFRNPPLHAELFGSIRFDVGWRATTDDGLPPATLGVEPGLRAAFALLRHWPIMKALNRIGVHRALGFRAAYLPCMLAPHLGAIVSDLPVEHGALHAGCALERIWLKTESLGLAFQPLAASALLAFPEYSDVAPDTRARLREGWRSLTGQTPYIVFRIGRAKRPRMRTARKPSEDYVIET